jgi:tetratricopeptide (TPR) repeat protein
MRREVFICLLLAGITLGIYWPARHFDLIYFDDPLVLTDCAPVQAGLTWASLKWAFTSIVIAHWHPVTNLSFLVVAQFFGTAPGVHHLVNAGLHAANAALLFWLLRALTGMTWRSAIVAAIFAWHPLRVESVAWIVERKDVLCAFFTLLALLAYTRFAQAQVVAECALLDAGKSSSSPVGSQPTASRRHRASFYFLALLFFALALLSKPMAVTLPLMLLLLDVWPLGRISNFKWEILNLKRLLLEKIPFFALTVIFCVATAWIQHHYAAMTPLGQLGLDARVANAISGYLAYPEKMFWPVNLAVIYPYPKSYDGLTALLKAGALLAISCGCLLQFARRPWLAVGWFWYLLTALPVIGLVQVGEQSMADRYTYLPLVGPVIAVVWTLAELFSRTRAGKIILSGAAVLILLTLAVLSERQLQFWRNTISLFEHNLAVTPDNASAHFTLGIGLEHAGETNRALACYRAAKKLAPADVQTRRNLASLLLQQGELAAAETEYGELLALNPDDFSTHASFAQLLAAQGRDADALFQLNEAVRLNPDSGDALNNLAWTLATTPHAEWRDVVRAGQLAQHACELTQFQTTRYLGTLAAAQAAAGKFDEAIVTAQRACELATKNGETDLLHANQELLARYRAHQTATEN